MEELWRDIALSAAAAASASAAAAASASLDLETLHPNCQPTSLQDFLAGPLNRPPVLPPPPPQLPTSPPADELGLSLNSAPADQFTDADAAAAAAPQLHARQFDAYFCPPDSSGFGGTGDRRHKRMIKNRESAARSRARKQAYTNELEIEVEHLLEENATLKKQYEELRVAMAAQLPTKSTHQRRSSSPF